MTQIVQTFCSGNYSALVRKYVDRGSLTVNSPEERAYLIGALVFVGRRQDAKAEFAAQMAADPLDARTIARFFLGIGACRDSEYSESHALFAENFRTRAQLQSGSARFFVFQGFGFLRYFCSRYSKSVLWSERAWRLAFAQRFQYGMILSADLRGHGLVQAGHVARGLGSLAAAGDLAREEKNAGLSTAVEVSTLGYRAQFGLLPRASAELEQAWRTLLPGDTYSRSNLLLELARALILEGQVEQALSRIDEGVQEVFLHGHRRQKALLLARRAHGWILQGKTEAATEAIAEGLKLLEPAADHAYRLELLGLRLHIASDPETRALVEALTRTTGRGVAVRMRGRGKLLSHGRDDDALGSLLDSLALAPHSVELLLQAERKGWLGIFSRIVEREAGTAIYLDLLPKRMVIFSNGNVHASLGTVPATLKRLLIILAQGGSDKQKLIETVWGYKYNSLRHDAMLYNSIYRLRQLLGAFESLLVAEDGRYSWSSPVVVRVFERAVPLGGATDFPIEEVPGLSLRQHRALELIRSSRALSVAAYVKNFNVAKPTATRDLADLVVKGYLVRTGRARATAYVLKGS